MNKLFKMSVMVLGLVGAGHMVASANATSPLTPQQMALVIHNYQIQLGYLHDSLKEISDDVCNAVYGAVAGETQTVQTAATAAAASGNLATIKAACQNMYTVLYWLDDEYIQYLNATYGSNEPNDHGHAYNFRMWIAQNFGNYIADFVPTGADYAAANITA